MHFYVFEVDVEFKNLSMQELVAFTVQVDPDLNMIHWIEFVLIYLISLTWFKVKQWMYITF